MNQNKIYVGNLSFDTTTADLESHFKQFGEPQDVRLITDRETGRSKGFAFITFESEREAQASLVSDGIDFKGRKIRVNLAREDDRKKRSSGGQSGSKHW